MSRSTAPACRDSRRRIDLVADRLDHAYGRPRWGRHRPPLDELILTVLSQHTSDVNTERAFRKLRDRFPTWELVRTALTAAVADAIHGGGLAELKAPRIQAILSAIQEERGLLDLDHLAGLSLPEARRWLLDLPGVGPKTAACVLLFSFGRPALPVDTHVHRVAGRLGLLPPGTGAVAAHDVLETELGGDRDRVYAFHINLIAHGRAVCRARRPSCERCSLTECCDYFLAAAAPLPRAAPAPAPSDLG